MNTAIILGINSDIAKNISGRLIGDGWQVFGTSRSSCDFASNASIDKAVSMVAMPWDLLLCAVGSLNPIGKFSGIHPDDWETSVRVNALGPLRMFNHLIPHRNKDASAVFFSGTNPMRTNPLYSAYSGAKALLARAVQEIDSELDIKCFTIAPGFVKTKIHDVHDVANRSLGTTHEQIYECLKHSIARPKSDVGGKTIFVPYWYQLFKEMS